MHTHQEFEPNSEFREIVKCFWYDYRTFDEPGSVFEVLPDGYTEIIFYFGKLQLLSANGEFQTLPSPFLAGLLNEPLYFRSDSKLEVIGIRCFPWGIFNLLNLPADKGKLHLLENSIAALQPQLAALLAANKISEAIALSQSYLLAILNGASGDHRVSKAGEAIRAAHGTLPVSEVAEVIHSTVRTLERNFKQSAGRTVKDVSALVRFEQVRNRLWANPELQLAGLAHELGYTDQAHLSKEFKRFSRTTPAAFARNAKKQKRVFSDNFVAFIQS
ncbi:helix-turn-helix domain-containing protein [Mucilaginibacter sp. RS28]|uniref:Helix-turn-helix domain-containing protein n=1 Tax=Mucilaginibacter straminoryzae TaxID=2932774 RepID=A0A9X1X6F9_9SPHI|nr:helix-turn-helix domain-containing protein [Mucilaginibacter straminoryzae]MCJ8211000.1 helix-turn-helix domain-containing protein [Mucilaginibacter straminoryzae]